MKTSKSVLVISTNEAEIELIRKIFHRIDSRITLLSVNSGRDALDALMGGFRGLKELSPAGNPFRPDLILIDETLNDMRAYAFLEIIRKYYTLLQIKSYLLTEEITEWQENAHYALVDGFLQRPVVDDPETLEIFKLLVGKLNEDSAAGMPLLGLAGANALKGKIMTLKGAGALIKAAACIAGVTIITAAVSVNKKERSTVRQMGHLKTVNIQSPGNLIADTDSIFTLDTLPALPVIHPSPSVVKAEEEIIQQDTIAIIAEEISKSDSTRIKKTFGIRVLPGIGLR